MSRYLTAIAVMLALATQAWSTASQATPPGPAATSASSQFAALNQQAHAARQSGDKQAYLAAALQMQTLLNHSPASTEAVAKAYAAAGDTPHALGSLKEFAEMGQTDETLAGNAAFASLKELPEYKTILTRIAQNKTPSARSETAFTLPDPGLLAEDIAYDARSKSFLISSVLEQKIIRVTPEGKATDFAQSPSHWPIFALKIDSTRKLAWATESATDGFTSAPKSDWGKSALLCFDLQTGKLLKRIEGPAHTALGDMALTDDGSPLVTDGDGGGIYLLTGDHLELVNATDFLSPQTPTMIPGTSRALVPDYLRGIALLDLKTKRVTWLQAPRTALSGIDGLYLSGNTLYLTQNGASPERVIRLTLDKTLARVVSEEIIEQATPTLGDPTHGVVVGDAFYYIANSGWNNLDEHGEVKPGAKLTPARIMRVGLR